MNTPYRIAEKAYNENPSRITEGRLILEQVRSTGKFRAPNKPRSESKSAIKTYTDYRDKVLSLIDAVEGYSDEKKIIAKALGKVKG